MGKRERAKNRCPECLMSAPLCLCAERPAIATTTSVIIVMHHREVKMPTNTGRLAHQCLTNSALVLRGLKDEPRASTSHGRGGGLPSAASDRRRGRARRGLHRARGAAVHARRARRELRQASRWASARRPCATCCA